MIRPWEQVDAFGNNAPARERNPFVVVAQKTTNVNPGDTAEVEYVEINPQTKLSVIVLSENSWNPIWIRSQGRNRMLTTGVEKLYNRYYNVMMILDGESTNVWMDERELSKLTWG